MLENERLICGNKLYIIFNHVVGWLVHKSNLFVAVLTSY